MVWGTIHGITYRFFTMFTRDLYVQVFEDRVRVRNIDTGQVAEQRSEQRFSHPRALVGSFTEANTTLKAAVSVVKGTGFIRAFRIVIHAMEKCEGGLTEIEERVLRELALGAGAAKVVVHIGEPLSDAAARERLRKG